LKGSEMLRFIRQYAMPAYLGAALGTIGKIFFNSWQFWVILIPTIALYVIALEAEKED